MKQVGRREVWSLGEITAALGRRLDGIPSLWVEAEVADLRIRRGQVRFRLTDEFALDASMNEIVFERLGAKPSEGTLVHAYGRIGFHRPTSRISMRVERMEPAGEGLLLARIAELRARLEAEGLLDPARARRPPLLPRRIGLVTSGQGAARDDVVRNVWDRFPQADILLVDVPVQGEAAPGAIASALARLDAEPEVDVIVVARGGGSLEDLMGFNSERVCRAVASCGTAVVSAVGHEMDVTLCDLVADVRVSTPSAAAAAIVPDRAELDARLRRARDALTRGLVGTRRRSEERLSGRGAALAAALRARERRAADRRDAAASRLATALRRAAADAPRGLAESAGALERAARRAHDTGLARVDRAAALLGVLSPAATVARGYAIVRDDGGAVRSASSGLAVGQGIEIEMSDGRVGARVARVAR